MHDLQLEIHPLQPFLPANARILMLGSFPPPKAKWKMDFYYPNFQNDMWRIFGLAFFNDKDHFLTADKKAFEKTTIMDFLSERGIALSDMGKEVKRLKGNASDNFLEIIKPIDLKNILERIPACTTLVTTGEKATETLRSLLPDLIQKPPVGSFVETLFEGKTYQFYRMPSSSRAYPKPVTEKARVYLSMFNELGIR